MQQVSKGDIPAQDNGIALALVATRFIKGGKRGHEVDALENCDQLADWLELHSELWGGEHLPQLTEADLAEVRAARWRLRQSVENRVSETPLDRATIQWLNDCAASSHETSVLNPTSLMVEKVRRPGGFWPTFWSLIGRDAQRILESGHAGLHRCPAPACILFFWDESGGRRWCSSSCGNRVRVANHSKRLNT